MRRIRQRQPATSTFSRAVHLRARLIQLTTKAAPQLRAAERFNIRFRVGHVIFRHGLIPSQQKTSARVHRETTGGSMRVAQSINDEWAREQAAEQWSVVGGRWSVEKSRKRKSCPPTDR